MDGPLLFIQNQKGSQDEEHIPGERPRHHRGLRVGQRGEKALRQTRRLGRSKVSASYLYPDVSLCHSLGKGWATADSGTIRKQGFHDETRPRSNRKEKAAYHFSIYLLQQGNLHSAEAKSIGHDVIHVNNFYF